MLFLCLSNLQAQVDIVKKYKTIKLALSNVQRISVVSNQFFLYTKDSVFVINNNGKITDKSSQNLKKGSSYDSENNYSITSNGKLFKSSELLLDYSGKLSKDNKIAKFLSKSDDSFFSCFVDSTNLSYSNGIYKIKKDGYSLFSYLVGIPSGLFVENNYLWYLYHKSVPNSNGMVRKYDKNTGNLLLEIEMPVIEPVGLYIQSDSCYVYSNYSQELVTLYLGGK